MEEKLQEAAIEMVTADPVPVASIEAPSGEGPGKKAKELKKDKRFRVKLRASQDFPTREFEVTFNPSKLTMRKMGVRNAPCLSISWRQLAGFLYAGSGDA